MSVPDGTQNSTPSENTTSFQIQPQVFSNDLEGFYELLALLVDSEGDITRTIYIPPTFDFILQQISNYLGHSSWQQLKPEEYHTSWVPIQELLYVIWLRAVYARNVLLLRSTPSPIPSMVASIV